MLVINWHEVAGLRIQRSPVNKKRFIVTCNHAAHSRPKIRYAYIQGEEFPMWAGVTVGKLFQSYKAASAFALERLLCR